MAPRKEPEPPPPRVSEPARGPLDPVAAWRGLLAALGRANVSGNTAFTSFEGGVLTVAVRSQLWRQSAEAALQDPALCRKFFPGWQSTVVRLDSAVGQTGRELRSEADERRRVEARAAAERSTAVQALLRVFGGRIEEVEARTPEPDETPVAIEEVPDE